MRVLYLNPSGQMGGAESSLASLLKSLRRLRPDWHLSLLLGEDGPLAASAIQSGIEVQVLRLPPELSRLGCSAGIDWDWARRALGAAIAIRRYRRDSIDRIRGASPDVIHSNGLKMHLLTASIPRENSARRDVCQVHDYAGSRGVARWLLQAGLKQFDQVVATSRSVAADLLALEVQRQRLSTIYNGIRLDRFSPEGETSTASRFRWRETADKVASVYRAVAGETEGLEIALSHQPS